MSWLAAKGFNPAGQLVSAIRGSKLAQVLAIRDFRLLWIGAFLSFTGSWVQNVAQGHFVYELTGDESKLGLVTICWSLPVCFFGLGAGSFADTLSRRTVLVITQLLLGLSAIYLAVVTWNHTVRYEAILIIAFINGMISSVEMPTRQSTVSDVVPSELLSAAVPVNAMTFNVARVFGPALGGIALTFLGVAWCYMLNGLSFLALIWAALAIRANLAPKKRDHQPLWDLITEGARYTFRDKRLRTLFLLEFLMALCGLALMPLLPAYVVDVLNMRPHLINGQLVDPSKQALATAFTCVGIGSLSGLLVVTALSHLDVKHHMIRISMFTLGITFPLLGSTRNPALAYGLLAVIGSAMIVQLNTTNTLFQILSPERLRGRVLAMHIWAVNGLSPMAILLFSRVANVSRLRIPFSVMGSTYFLPPGGVGLSMELGGVLVLGGAIISLLAREGMSKFHAGVKTHG